jgi:hypothetical protein
MSEQEGIAGTVGPRVLDANHTQSEPESKPEQPQRMTAHDITINDLRKQLKHWHGEALRLNVKKNTYKERLTRQEAQLKTELARLEAKLTMQIKVNEERARSAEQREKTAQRQEKFWKRITAAAAVICLTLATVAVLKGSEPGSLETVAIEILAEESAAGEEWQQVALSQMPDHVWSTGIVFNGNTAGSAVIISPTGEGLSCGHCFKGVKGGKFTIRRPDGTDVEAELLEHIPHRGWGSAELCLFRINPEDVIDWAPICLEELPDAEIDIIGYPMTHGPVYHPLVELRDSGSEMRVYRVTDGHYVMSGNSGSPIFRNGTLDAIVAGVNNEQAATQIADFDLAGWRRQQRLESRQQAQPGQPGPKAIGINAIATKRETLIQFVKGNARKFRNGNQPFCDGKGNCYDANGNLIPKQGQPQQAQPGVAPMQPNLPMPAKPNAGADAPYDGKKRPPKDLNGNRKQAVEIDKLRKANPGQTVQPGQPLPPFTPQNNPGEVAPPADQPGPAPAPQVSPPDLSLHSKVDTLTGQVQTLQNSHNTLASKVTTGLSKILTPDDLEKLKTDLLTNQQAALQKLGPQFQQAFQQALADNHGNVVAAFNEAATKLGPQLAEQVKADAEAEAKSFTESKLPQIAQAVAKGPLGQQIAAVKSATESGGLNWWHIAGIGAAALIPGIGGPALMGKILSKSIAGQAGANPQAIVQALAPHLQQVGNQMQGVVTALGQQAQTAASQNDSLTSLTSAFKSLATPVASLVAGQQQAAPNQSSTAPPATAPPPSDAVMNLLNGIKDAVSQLKNSPQLSTPAPAGAQTAPATPWNAQSIVPIRVADPKGNAIQQATIQLLQRNPNISLLEAQPQIDQLAQTILGLTPQQAPVASTSNL